jgi:hypothetical protein
MLFQVGEIKQLTFYQSNNRVVVWNWDSKTINFISNRYNRRTNYTASIYGSTSKRIFMHFFNTVYNAVQHLITKDIYFNESE